jgi:hypothetical protein
MSVSANGVGPPPQKDIQILSGTVNLKMNIRRGSAGFCSEIVREAGRARIWAEVGPAHFEYQKLTANSSYASLSSGESGCDIVDK